MTYPLIQYKGNPTVIGVPTEEIEGSVEPHNEIFVVKDTTKLVSLESISPFAKGQEITYDCEDCDKGWIKNITNHLTGGDWGKGFSRVAQLTQEYKCDKCIEGLITYICTGEQELKKAKDVVKSLSNSVKNAVLPDEYIILAQVQEKA